MDVSGWVDISAMNSESKKLHNELQEDPRDKEESNKNRRGSTSIWISTKQSMSYVTVSGIESDTSWPQQDWPKQCAKEMSSNAWDWHQDYYPNGTKETRKIELSVKIDSIQDHEANIIIIRIRVRNSNPDNIPVFENLQPIFDYKQFYSTKAKPTQNSFWSLG